MPTILTSITTAVGFLALVYTDIRLIQELGLLAAFSGFFVPWFFSIFCLIPLLSIFR